MQPILKKYFSQPMTQIPVFVISLKTSTERRNIITKRLKELNIKFEFFNATDGRDLPQKEILEIQNECKDLMRVRGFPMQAGEIGCSLSHKAVYEKIIKENIDYACILEDDAILTPEFVNCIKQESVEKIFDKECIIMLGHFLYGSTHKTLTTFWRKIRFTNKTILKIPIQGNHGSFGYVIDRKTAKKILSSLYTVTVPIDDLTGSSELNGILRYVACPPDVLLDHSLESLMIERIKWDEKILKNFNFNAISQRPIQKAFFHIKQIFLKFKERIFYILIQLEILSPRKEILNFRVSGYRMK
jgi:glycosyl transferase family 25